MLSYLSDNGILLKPTRLQILNRPNVSNLQVNRYEGNEVDTPVTLLS